MLEFLNDGGSFTALDDITIRRDSTDYETTTSLPASSNPNLHSTSPQNVTVTGRTTTFSSPTSRAPNDTTQKATTGVAKNDANKGLSQTTETALIASFSVIGGILLVVVLAAFLVKCRRSRHRHSGSVYLTDDSVSYKSVISGGYLMQDVEKTQLA
ncbi:unnamed protein product [Lymnaea stagnalis]|uniref:Uncharacterized protein n=1 Tax=Lymnaea stagnalis TaxID=6523 RepID=A0AAV2GYL8_LYMST